MMETNTAEQSRSKTGQKSLVLVDRYTPQFFDFDKPFVSEEITAKEKTAIEILLDNKHTVFNAETSDLYSNQIRIVCSKTVPLEQDDLVHLNFTAIYQKNNQEYLLNIPCQISQVIKFKQITHAILTFGDELDSQYIQWYQQWLSKLSEAANKDEEIDARAFQFIYQYYKRLYSEHLNYPVIFNDAQQIKHAYISKMGISAITFFDANNNPIYLPTTIFQAYINLPKKVNRIPLYVWYENDQFNYFSNVDHPTISPKKILSWLVKKPQWRVLLIRKRQTVPADAIQLNEIKQYVSNEAVENAASFEEAFFNHSITTNIVDISSIFTHINLPEYKESLTAKEITMQKSDISYQVLSFDVNRSEPRFVHSSTVRLKSLAQTQNASVQAETIDISFLGLNIKIISDSYGFVLGETVLIEFTQWNEELPKSLLKKTEQFKAIEYQVENIGKQYDGILLELRRIKRDADPKLNSLIQDKINAIQNNDSGHIQNNFDLYQSLIASLWINNNISGLVFYLGKDNEGIRIVQAIVNTQENLKIRQPYLSQNDWSFLQQIALPLSMAVSKINPDDKNKVNQLSLGVYCYYDNLSPAPSWITKTDLDFNLSATKFDFIKTAISFKKHYFYHCSLAPIKAGKDDILNDESSSLVSFKAHRLKEIHEICNSLIAVGELNEVTRLVEFMYKNES